MLRPKVELVNYFAKPLEVAVSAARTCYSPRGVVKPHEISKEERNRLAKFLRKAGHLTTFQHVYLQYAISNVSRQFVWAFLHSHPFYNSDQVSQRYVTVREGNFYIPPLNERLRSIYESAVAIADNAYRKLIDVLSPVAASLLVKRFPYLRRMNKELERRARKKAQEVARYVLPVATFTYLYHTVNLVTLMRYWKLCRNWEIGEEGREVVSLMVSELLKIAPEADLLFKEGECGTFEERIFKEFIENFELEKSKRFFVEFDESLKGRLSKLVDYKQKNEEVLADSVREVLGLPRDSLNDDEAIALAMDPSFDPLLADTLNLTYQTRLHRAMAHVSYTFRKKLSHTADSQEQRHRTVSGSRPYIHFAQLEEPDYIMPILIESCEEAKKIYIETMERIWEKVQQFIREGGDRKKAIYLLPNALTIRFTESTDLLALRHKMAMRLCYNAQEEIWRATLDEREEIEKVNPRIARYLLPPCGLRYRAGVKPYCPEGRHFCGVVVWQRGLREEDRII